MYGQCVCVFVCVLCDMTSRLLENGRVSVTSQ